MIIIILLLGHTFQSKPLVTREYIEQLRKEVTWEVVSYEDSVFKDWTEEDFINSFGNGNYAEPVEVDVAREFRMLSTPPDNFDGREEWGSCIHPIRYQGLCGSCWSFALTSALSDRFCIGGHDVILSPQYLIACVKDTDINGCSGGNSVKAMKHIITNGVVTEKCYPYTLAKTKTTPHCPTQCTGIGSWTERYRCKSGSNKILRDVEDMKWEIMNNGPICTHFEHRPSFNVYKSGIYDCTEPPYNGVGHFLKTIGWGIDNETEYWILANSYGTAWGEAGYIRFKMEACGIDDYMYICTPDIYPAQ